MTLPEKSNVAGIGLSPYLLAERLDAATFSDQVNPDGTTLDAAWQSLDRFLADDASQEYLDERVERVFFDALHIAENSTTKGRKIRAQMLLANLNLLALRGRGDKIEADDITNSYHMMTGVLAENIQYYRSRKASKLTAEIITFALIARQSDTMNIPFVSSSRERKTTWMGCDHGLYTVDDAMTLKTPVRVFGYYVPEAANPIHDAGAYSHHLGKFFKTNVKDLEIVLKTRAAHPNETFGEVVARLIIDEPYEGYAPDSLENVGLTALSSRLITQLNEHRFAVIAAEIAKNSAPTALAAKTNSPPRLPKMPPPPVLPLAPSKKSSPSEIEPSAPAEPQPDDIAPEIVAEPLAEPLPETGRALLPSVKHRKLDGKAFFMKYYGQTLVNPYLQAEYIPLEVLESQPIASDDRLVGGLWKTVELGLARHDYAQVMEADNEAQNIAQDERQSAVVRIGAAMLHANSGLLASRATGRAITEIDILKSFQTMAHVLSNVQAGDYGELDPVRYAGIRPELVNYCLVAYNADPQFIPFLGSRREEQSRLIEANHDMYTLSNKVVASKVAAQIKNRFQPERAKILGTPDAPLHSFLFPIYAEEVLQKYAIERGFTRMQRNTLDGVAQLIVGAAAGASLTPRQVRNLQGFSQSVLGLFIEHREFLRTEDKFHKMPFTSLNPKEFVGGL